MQTAALPPIIVRWVKRLSEEYYGALVLIVLKAARNGTPGLVLTARVGRLWSLSRNFRPSYYEPKGIGVRTGDPGC